MRRFIMFAAALLLVGCGGIDEGWVTHKEYVPMIVVPVYNAALKITTPMVMPEHWSVYIRDEEGNDGKCSVSERAYIEVEIDQYFVCRGGSNE